MKLSKQQKRKLDRFKKSPQRRAITLDATRMEIDEEARTIEVAFSSEAEILRWFGYEVLGHGSDEVNLERFENGAAVLVNHDTGDHIGVVDKVWIDSTTGRAVIRFGSGDRASEVFKNVSDGIWRHISVGYFIHEMVLEKEVDDGPNVYRVSDWEPYEISLVAVPADISVGVGRTFGVDMPDGSPELSQEAVDEAVRKAFKKVSTGGSNMDPEEKARLEKEAEEKRQADIKAATDAAREAAQTTERARVAELMAVGEKYGADDLAREAINAGNSVHDLNQKILERGGLKVTKAEDPDIGMTQRDLEKFRFNRLIIALADPGDRANQEAAAFELECSRAAAEKLKRDPRGSGARAMIPFDVLTAKRAMSVGTAAAGGDLVETELLEESFIDKLDNALALVQCGVTMLPGLNGNIAIPRQTGGASHFWLAENGVPTESNATFDQIAMTPKTVGAFTEISRRLLLQASIGAEAFTINELALRLALAIDLAGINGTGASNQPTGVLNYSGVGVTALGTNGAAPTWDSIVDMETDVASNNAVVGNLRYLTNAKFRGKSKKVFIDAGSGERIWDSRSAGTPLNGYPVVVSNQVPSNLVKGSSGAVCSAAIFGNWSDLIIGMWGGLDIQVNPYSLDTKGAIRVTSFQDVDIQIRHPESFNIIVDALTT